MEKHICYDKLQKKKQREIDQMKRGSWLGGQSCDTQAGKQQSL